jgi:hypothetical protein
MEATSREEVVADMSESSLPVVVDRWEERVGSIRVFEHTRRKGVLYLRWRQEGNWAYLSLSEAAQRDGFPTATLADDKGRPLTGRALERKKKWAMDQAEAHLAVIRAAKPRTEPPKPAEPLTLGKTWALISDPETGQYPVDTPYRKDVERELGHAVRILGADTTWLHRAENNSARKDGVNRSQLTKLWRTRIRELRVKDDKDDEQTVGLRGAEITVSRLLAIATWLRDHEHIPGDAAVAPSNWRKALRSDWLQIAQDDRLPEPARPRLAADQFRKLFDATWDVDPRLGLMYALGAELRGGQVKRARRSDLDLPPLTEANIAAENYGRFKSPGRGKKLGQVVLLTKEQRAAWERAVDPETGYLRLLEGAYQRGELTEYFLFPSGQMEGGRLYRRSRQTLDDPSVTIDPRTPTHPVATIERHTATHVTDTAVRKWFKAAERRAVITSVKGRAWYGGRRAGVDLAKKAKISREGLQEYGGWSDSQVPDEIYADEEREYAREESKQVRAKVRRQEGEKSDG